MIEIVKWSECFESADTRKRQRLGWFLSPSGCDSKGFRKLMRDGVDGLAAIGFFQAICQSMATMAKEIRQSGTFKNSDGTLMDFDDILEVSRLSGMQVADHRQITGRLVACGWICLHKPLDNQQSATCLPPVCQSPPGFVQGEGEGQEEGEGKGEDPPNPQGGMEGSDGEKNHVLPKGWQNMTATQRKQSRVLTNSKAMNRIGKLMGRRDGTLWTVAEAVALKSINPQPDEIDLMEIYYLAEIDKDSDYRRRDLLTLLNNWNGELDRARIFKSSNQ